MSVRILSAASNVLTSVDETHGDVELLDVELASVVHVGESPARRRRTKREVTVSSSSLDPPPGHRKSSIRKTWTHQIFAMSSLLSPLCPKTS